MKFVQLLLLLASSLNLVAQGIEIDSLSFFDTLLFEQKVTYSNDGRINFIEYLEINGEIKKIEYYDSNQLLRNVKVWRKVLIQDIKYTYAENKQVIKRFDVLNQKALPPHLNVYFRYPAMAREMEIEGVVEVSLEYDEDCIPVAYRILNEIKHGINKEVNKKMKVMMMLARKYEVRFDECKMSNENFKIHFNLE